MTAAEPTTMRDAMQAEIARLQGQGLHVDGDVVIGKITVSELEEAWGLSRDQWGRIGPPYGDDEPLWVRRCRSDYEALYGYTDYRIDRLDARGEAYPAFEHPFDSIIEWIGHDAWRIILPRAGVGQILPEWAALQCRRAAQPGHVHPL